MRWSYDLTREELPHNAQRVEWALQIRQRRFARKMPSGRIPVGTRRIIGIIASTLGLLAAFYLRRDPLTPESYHGLLTGVIAFFACAFVLSIVLPGYVAAQRRWIGRRLARRAASLMKRMEARTPATLAYELAEDHLDVRCPTMPELRPIALAQHRLVMHAGTLVFVFRGRAGITRMRTIYVPGDAERQAVLAAFTRHGAEIIELTGPLADYADPLPVAKTR